MNTFLSEKSAPLLELKTNSTPGEFVAVISAIGNVDRQGDKVMPGAFAKAISEDPIPPIYWAHKHDIPPIGEGLEWKEQGGQVIYTGRLFVKGDARHEWAEMVYAGMKSYDGRPPVIRQFSYTYGIPDGGAERVMEDGKAIRLLHEIRPVAEVGPCFLGANSETNLLVAAKSAQSARELAEIFGVEFSEKDTGAIWTPEYLASLPDAAFLYVEEKQQDDGEKTIVREFAYKNADGVVDVGRLREALQQISVATDERYSPETRERLRVDAEAILLKTEDVRPVEFDFFQLARKAEWDTAYMDNLPDSAFLHVESGGKKDSSGKTVPRSLRHFPYKNAQDMIDMPHLRNAIDRAPDATSLPERTRMRVQGRAKRLLRSQDGKALLLGVVHSTKAWDDVEGYAVQTILPMLDGAVSYIQMERDPGDVAQMQTAVQILLGLIARDFNEAATGNDAAKSAVEMAAKMYEFAAETPVLSEAASKVTDREIAALLALGPIH